MKEILSAGVMGMPALMINGKLMVSGSVPPRRKLTEWLEQAAGRRG